MALSTTWAIQNFSGVPGSEVPNAVGLGRTVDRLLVRTADELSGLYGLLADGVALSTDGKSLFVHLNRKARWHDGVPMTTDDVRFSYDEMQKTVFGKVYLSSWVESLEIVGPHEMVIHHRNQFTNANLVALTWFPIRPAHYYADRDPSKPTLEPPVGSGPYRVAELAANFIRYVRVDDYWARDHPVNRGRYNFDEIRFSTAPRNGPNRTSLDRRSRLADCRHRPNERCLNRFACNCRRRCSRSRSGCPSRASRVGDARRLIGPGPCSRRRVGALSTVAWRTQLARPSNSRC